MINVLSHNGLSVTKSIKNAIYHFGIVSMLIPNNRYKRACIIENAQLNVFVLYDDC